MATWNSAAAQPFRLAAVSDQPMNRPPAAPARRCERKHGGDCDLNATLGRAPDEAVSPDDQVSDWVPVPGWMAG
jgi:hypothetical protein